MTRKLDTEITCFKMLREGEFLANWTTMATKCGPLTAQPIYKYVCDITTAPQLDENGFILDNLEIHNYFVKTYSKQLPAVSCERMAAHAVKTIRLMATRIQLPLISVSVSISGMPGAWLTATYNSNKRCN